MPPAAKPTPDALLTKLAEKFDVEDHKTNPKGYTYIAIEKVINRFNSVLGAAWSLNVRSTDFALIPGQTYGARNPKQAAYAIVTVDITVHIGDLIITRSGVGGDNGAFDDADKLIKTALAEAIKKAGHQFGVGLYLWDEEERALIEAASAAGMTGQVVAASAAPTTPPETAPLVAAPDPTELEALKNRVADLAVLEGVQRTGPAIAAHFGVPIEGLQNTDQLRAIIASREAAAPAAGA